MTILSVPLGVLAIFALAALIRRASSSLAAAGENIIAFIGLALALALPLTSGIAHTIGVLS